MSVTVTASNGWVHKPITEEDATAFIKSFNDYPLSPGDIPITYEEIVNRFSECLLANNTGTLPLSSDNDDGVFKEVPPKKGRAVIFPGNVKHSSSTPIKNSRRMIINFNFLI